MCILTRNKRKKAEQQQQQPPHSQQRKKATKISTTSLSHRSIKSHSSIIRSSSVDRESVNTKSTLRDQQLRSVVLGGDSISVTVRPQDFNMRAVQTEVQYLVLFPDETAGIERLTIQNQREADGLGSSVQLNFASKEKANAFLSQSRAVSTSHQSCSTRPKRRLVSTNPGHQVARASLSSLLFKNRIELPTSSTSPTTDIHVVPSSSSSSSASKDPITATTAAEEEDLLERKMIRTTIFRSAAGRGGSKRIYHELNPEDEEEDECEEDELSTTTTTTSTIATKKKKCNDDDDRDKKSDQMISFLRLCSDAVFAKYMAKSICFDKYHLAHAFVLFQRAHLSPATEFTTIALFQALYLAIQIQEDDPVCGAELLNFVNHSGIIKRDQEDHASTRGRGRKNKNNSKTDDPDWDPNVSNSNRKGKSKSNSNSSNKPLTSKEKQGIFLSGVSSLWSRLNFSLNVDLDTCDAVCADFENLIARAAASESSTSTTTTLGAGSTIASSSFYHNFGGSMEEWKDFTGFQKQRTEERREQIYEVSERIQGKQRI